MSSSPGSARSSPSPRPRALGYLRVSTLEQATGGLGLAAQRSAIETACQLRDWELVDVAEDAGISAVGKQRPALERTLQALDTGQAGALVVAKLDRLARSLPDYADLVRRAAAKRWQLVALDTPESTTAQGEAMQAIVAVFAQLERRLISDRTREALAAARARGVRLGRPVQMDDATRSRILALHRRRWSARRIARQLDDEGIGTPRAGAGWYAAIVVDTIRRDGLRPRSVGRPRSRGDSASPVDTKRRPRLRLRSRAAPVVNGSANPHRSPRALCPRCGREVALRRGGELREHRVTPAESSLCPASGSSLEALRLPM